VPDRLRMREPCRRATPGSPSARRRAAFSLSAAPPSPCGDQGSFGDQGTSGGARGRSGTLATRARRRPHRRRGPDRSRTADVGGPGVERAGLHPLGAARRAYARNAPYVASNHGMAGLAHATFLDVRGTRRQGERRLSRSGLGGGPVLTSRSVRARRPADPGRRRRRTALIVTFLERGVPSRSTSSRRAPPEKRRSPRRLRLSSALCY